MMEGLHVTSQPKPGTNNQLHYTEESGIAHHISDTNSSQYQHPTEIAFASDRLLRPCNLL